VTTAKEYADFQVNSLLRIKC